ncbi:unnamed protein product [Ixodes pacificus]
MSPYDQTLDGQDFLLHQGSVQGTHFLICDAANNMKLLCDSTTVLGDGPFFVAPKVYTQLYTLHSWCGLAVRAQKMRPLVYILATSRTEEPYVHAFETLKTVATGAEQMLSPPFLVVNFEMAAMNAIRRTFPATVLKGCLFHFSQYLYGKMQNAQLQTRYAEDPGFSLKMRILFALAFLPDHQIRAAYVAIKPLMPHEATKVLKHLEKNFILGKLLTLGPMNMRMPPLFSPQVWSVADLVDAGQPRSTNHVEAWHRRFKTVVGVIHSGVFRLAYALR